MNKVILQIWEESDIRFGIMKDGCSLHIDGNERDQYVFSVYSKRDESSIPDKYERVVGEPVEVFVEDNIWQIILLKKTIKLSEDSFQNLYKFGEILFDKNSV